MVEKIRELVTYYGHAASNRGCTAIVDEWRNNKRHLIGVLSNHPNWDADNFRIVFSQDYVREFDSRAIHDFWSEIQGIILEKIIRPNEYRIDGFTLGEAEEKRSTLEECVRNIRFLKKILNPQPQERVFGKTVFEWELEYQLAKNRRNEFSRLLRASEIYDYHGTYVSKKLCNRVDELRGFTNILAQAESHIVDNDLVRNAKDIFPDLHTGAGCTITKLLRKVLDKYYPELFTWRQEERREWVNPTTGELMCRTREITLDTLISRLADRISPLKIKRHTVISLNPLDYLTMSFGHKWASCHTIDIHNKRGSANTYSGRYCSGTLSYMLDSASIIFYTVDSEYNGNAFETQDKMNRCMFHLSENGNVLVQGRVYPDGRDGGDMSLAKQFREVMQKVISDCLDKDNHWKTLHGTEDCLEWAESYGTHYRDYEEYDDCSVSLRIGYPTETVEIGHDPIDPYTGYEHETEESLNDQGDEYVICAHCGARIYREDAVQCYETDEWYCDSDCAEYDDVYFCEDDERYHSDDNCWRDDYDGYHYYNNPEVETEDGNQFSSEYNAERAGYRQIDDGAWYLKQDTFTDSYDECVYHIDDLEVDIDIDHKYISAENAEEDGCVYVNGTWYISQRAAIEAGEYEESEVA